MSKLTLIVFALMSLLFLGNSSRNYAESKENIAESQPGRRSAEGRGTGTLQKMIVENGSVSINLDLNRLNGIHSASQSLQQTHFAVGANSFFPILVFNDLLRGTAPGTMTLIPAGVDATGHNNLPVALSSSLNRLVVEKLPSGQDFDLAVRDGNTGFTFFNIQGHQYDYDPIAKSLAISGGRLLISKELAEAMGRPSTA